MNTTLDAVDPYVAERRGEILAGAHAVFVRHGFERATMAQIASEVGLTAGALYRYFPSKEALIATVCGSASAEMLQPFDEPPEDLAAFDLLVAAGEAIWGGLSDAGAMDGARMLLEATVAGMRHPDEVGAPLASEMTATREQLTELIEVARGDGALRADVDPAALASLLIGATLGMKMLMVQLDGDVEPGAAWGLLRRMVEGLRPEEAK